MSDDTIDIAVLRGGPEGLSTADYARALRDRLPGATVVHASTPAEEHRAVAEATVATGITIDPALLEDADRLRLFACTFSGTDHVPLEALEAAGVAVTNASGIHAPGIAEQVLGYLLVFARRLYTGWERKRRHEWRHFQSSELKGSTVTIVGLGSIGKAVADRLAGFDVETIGVRYTPGKGGPTDEVVGFDADDVHDALARSRYVVLACPLTDLTRGLIGAAEFETLPPESVLVNVSRGPVVETDALVTALQTSSIRGAALDVTDPEPLPADHPLWRLENCLLTPHIGGHTPKHWDRLAAIVGENVETLRATGSVDDLVNRVA